MMMEMNTDPLKFVMEIQEGQFLGMVVKHFLINFQKLNKYRNY